MSTAGFYGVVGNPIAHSQSPWIHAQFAKQTGITMTYDAIESAPDAFVKTVQNLRKRKYSGLNITVPFKHTAFELAATYTPRAQLAQAANTLAWQVPEGKKKAVLHADNTDGAGFVRDLMFTAGLTFGGEQVLLLGAGGAAAGVLGSLIAVAAAGVTVANRTQKKAQQLVEKHRTWANMHGVALHACGLDDVLYENEANQSLPEKYALVINATSSSLAGEVLTIPTSIVKPDTIFCDLMYGKAARPFLEAATAQSWRYRTRDGLGMLVEQAALSFALWHGVRPNTVPVLAELRKIVDVQ